MRTLLFFIACVLLLRISAAASTALPSENQVTPSEFEKKIEQGLAVIADRKPFSVEDATMLVRLANTLFLLDRTATKKEAELQKQIWGGDFTQRLKAALGDAIINKGMGYYFPKPDIHLGGSGGNIRDRDRYAIVAEKKKEANQRPVPMAVLRAAMAHR